MHLEILGGKLRLWKTRLVLIAPDLKGQAYKIGGRGMKQRTRLIITAILVVCIGAAIGLLFTPIFEVNEVVCVGNNRLSYDSIIEASQVKIGQNIMFQRVTRMEKNLLKLPDVEETNVRRLFPNKIKIWVKERVPAGYFILENQCVAADLEGRVINIIEGEEGYKIVDALTPEKLETKIEQKEEQREEKKEKKKDEKKEDTPEETDKPQEEIQEEVNIPYSTPLVVGIEINNTSVGKEIQSKDKEKLEVVMEALKAFNKAGILSRMTYFDVENLENVILVIEKRLEVHLGNLDNIEYRAAFLTKIVNEKISSTEKAIMDYTGDDIYVKAPNDGKEWVTPKPKPEEEKNDENSQDDNQEDREEEKEDENVSLEG